MDNAATVTWYGQAAFRLEAEGIRVLIDPFLSDRSDRRYPPPVRAAELVDTTTVLCTHEHDDHLDLAFLAALFAAGASPNVVVPAPVVRQAIAGGVPPERLHPAVPGEPLRVGGATIHAVPAFHGVGGGIEPMAYGFASLRAPDEGHRFLGYVLELGGMRFYHAGDTLVYPEMARTVGALCPDVLMLPINGRDANRERAGIVGNMNEEEAARLAVDIGAPVVVPMHYEGFVDNPGDVGRFVRAVPEESGVTVVRLGRNRPHRFARV